MNRFLLFCGLALGGLAALPGTGQTLDNTFAVPTGLYGTAYLDAMGPAQADGKRLLGGYFTRINNTAVSSELVRLDATGALDQAFLQNVGYASEPSRIRQLANGQYLLSGQLGMTAGGLTRDELLRLNADGTADASFNAGTGTGTGYFDDFIVQADGKVVVGGSFSSFNGQTANGVVRLTANGSLDNTFAAGSALGSSTGYSEVMALAQQADGKLLVGGHFNSFSSQAASALVRLTTTGARDASFAAALDASDYIYGLLMQPDGRILVTGVLTVNGSRTSLARLLPSGALDPSFTLAPALGTQVYTTTLELPMLLQPDGKIVVVGGFDVPGYRRVARLNADGSLDATFQAPTGPDSYPSTLGLQPSGRILVGGNFTAVGNAETTLVQFTSTGQVDAAYAPKLQLPGNVTTLVRLADNSLLVGGNLTEWNGTTVHGVAHLSAAGLLDAAYSAGGSPLRGAVSALLVQADGKAVVGTNGNLYRLLPSGVIDPDFAQYATNALYVTALAQQPSGKLLVAGSVGNFGGGSAYARLTRLTTNGNFDGTFTAPATGAVGTPSALLAQADGRILLAANSTASGLTNISFLQRYEADGATDTSWPGPAFANISSSGTASTARVSALTQQADGKLLVGGRFTRVGSATQSGFARLALDGSLDAGFNAGSLINNLGAGVAALTVQPNGRILVGGNFQATGTAGGTYLNLLRVLPNGQLDPTFTNAANPNSNVSSIVVQSNGGIVLQGFFSSIVGQARPGLARLTAPGVLAVAAPGYVAAATTAWPVPAHEVLRVQPAASAHPLAAELLDALGRVVRQQALTGPAEVSFDTSALPAGLYVLRVRYAEGTVARQLAVE